MQDRFNSKNIFSGDVFVEYGFFTLKSFFLICCLASAAVVVRADVSVDSSSTGGAFSSTGVPAFSWNHTVTTTGNNRVLYVGVSTTGDAAASNVFPALCSTMPTSVLCFSPLPNTNSVANRVISVTYNSQTMERVGTSTSTDLTNAVEIFRLLNPPTGASYPVNVDLVDGISTNAVGGSISFIGADEPATQTFYLNSGVNSNPSLFVSGENGRKGIALGVVTTSPNAGFIIDPPATGQTEQWSGNANFFNAYDVGKGSTKSADPSAALNWNLTRPNYSWATGGVLVKSFVPLASPASVGGRIETSDAEPLSNVFVTLRNLQTGEEFSALTDENGVYNFEGLAPAQLYEVRASSKIYQFQPNSRILNLTESLGDIDFHATRRPRAGGFLQDKILHD